MVSSRRCIEIFGWNRVVYTFLDILFESKEIIELLGRCLVFLLLGAILILVVVAASCFIFCEVVVELVQEKAQHDCAVHRDQRGKNQSTTKKDLGAIAIPDPLNWREKCLCHQYQALDVRNTF